MVRAVPQVSKVLLSASSQGLRWSVADVVIDPWPPGSLAGRVRGGIRRDESIPGYFSERRFEQGKKKRMNRSVSLVNSPEPVEISDRLAYYLGPLHRHFGHAVVESSTRLWFYWQARHLAGEVGHLPLVMLPPAETQEHLESFEATDLAEWQQTLLQLYGVPLDAVHFVRAPVRFKRLIVPTQAWLWGQKPTRQTAAVASPPTFSNLSPDSGIGALPLEAERLYLVRGPELFWRGAVAGEMVIREFFRAHGYVLLDPLTLPLAEQLLALRRASHVFGIQGSAFHLFNLAGNSKIQVGILGRLGVEASRRFADSLEPFVSRFLLQSPDGADPSSDPAKSSTKFRLAFHRNVDRLLAFLTTFDPDLDPSRFDHQAYHREVEADRERFRHGSVAA